MKSLNNEPSEVNVNVSINIISKCHVRFLEHQNLSEFWSLTTAVDIPAAHNCITVYALFTLDPRALLPPSHGEVLR